MGKRKRAAIWVGALSIICGLLTWHVLLWHSTGQYQEMLSRIESGGSCLVVLYNLGLMLVLGAILGFLMEKITDLLRPLS